MENHRDKMGRISSTQNGNKVLIGKLEGNRNLARPKHGW
jgi:hypothetical protein